MAGGFQEFEAATFERDFAEENREVSDEDEVDKEEEDKAYGCKDGEKKHHHQDDFDDDGSGTSRGKPAGYVPRFQTTGKGRSSSGNDEGKDGGASSKHGSGTGYGARYSYGPTACVGLAARIHPRSNHDQLHYVNASAFASPVSIYGATQYDNRPGAAQEAMYSTNGYGNTEYYKLSDPMTDYKPGSKFITVLGLPHDTKLPGHTYLQFTEDSKTTAREFKFGLGGQVYVPCAVHESEAFLATRYDPDRGPSPPCYPMKYRRWNIGQKRIAYPNTLYDAEDTASPTVPELR